MAGEYPWPENSGSRMRLATVLRGLRRCGPVELFSFIPRVPHATSTQPDRGLGPATGWATWASTTDRRPVPASAGAAGRRDPRRWPSRGRTGRRPPGPGPVRRRATTTWSGTSGSGPGSWPGACSRRPPCSTSTTSRTRRSPPAWPFPARRRRPRGPSGSGAGWAGPWPRRRCGGGSACTAGPGHRFRRRWCAASSTPSGPGPAACARVAVIPNGYRRVGGTRWAGWRSATHRPSCSRAPSAIRPTPRPPVAGRRGAPAPPAGWSPTCASAWSGSTTPALAALDDRPRCRRRRAGPRHRRRAGPGRPGGGPVRFGSGTRVKILEAFAHRIPVVSTSLGAEGLGAEDGVHLLVGDDPLGDWPSRAPGSWPTVDSRAAAHRTRPPAVPRPLPVRRGGAGRGRPGPVGGGAVRRGRAGPAVRPLVRGGHGTGQLPVDAPRSRALAPATSNMALRRRPAPPKRRREVGIGGQAFQGVGQRRGRRRVGRSGR